MFRSCLIVVLSYCVAGFSADDCLIYVNLKQYLKNEGFHRNITYRVEFDNEENENFLKSCIVGLDQTLPAGVYANPDELGDLNRVRKLNAIPRNWVNIELPAEESHTTSVFIITNLINDQARTWLPVHARYHHATSDGGFASNEIGPPLVFLRCPDRRLEKCEDIESSITFLCSANSKEKCLWRQMPVTVLTHTLVLDVPVGNTSAYELITFVTACAIISGSLYLLKTLHEYKIMNKGM